MGQTEAALADAPGMDEPGLRQTLAIYQSPTRDMASADSDNPRDALTSSDSKLAPVAEKSPLPNVHLAVDPPATPNAAADTATASIKPSAGLPPTAFP